MGTSSDDEKQIEYNAQDITYMKAALAQARLAYKHGEVPIGCVIVYDGRIVGRGYNRRNTDKCTLAHAEITAIRRASKELGDWRLEECTMYVTLEPCQMCAGAIVQARIPRVIAGAASPKAGCAGSILNILNNNEFNHQVMYEQGLLEDRCTALLQKFFVELRDRNKKEKLARRQLEEDSMSKLNEECNMERKHMNYIFDVDGTLWNTTAIVAEAWNAAVCDMGWEEEFGRFITDKTLQTEFGKPMDEIMDDLFPNKTRAEKDKMLEVVKPLERDAVMLCETDVAYPRVVETMRLLAENNKLFIVSNCQAGYIETVMEKLGIEEYISDFESFGATGMLKADNIKLVVERNGLNPEDTVYVGDTAGDYYSTKEAGLEFVHASYGFGVMPEEFKGRVIQNFSDLLD